MKHVNNEDLWNAPHGEPYMIVVTTGSVTDGYGKLMMLGGSAAQAREVYPQLTRIAYQKIKEKFPEIRLNGREECYGFVELIPPPHGIGIFQNKCHHQATACIDAIRKSTETLAEYAAAHPEINIRLPFPGIHRPKWPRSQEYEEVEVKDLLTCLPDNVTITQWG
jgi:hypothetical protein